MGCTTIGWVYADAARERQDANEPVMLPHDIQLVECEQQIVAALVRLQTSDGGLIGDGQRPDFGHAARRCILEVRHAFADRKVHLPGADMAIARGKGAR